MGAWICVRKKMRDYAHSCDCLKERLRTGGARGRVRKQISVREMECAREREREKQRESQWLSERERERNGQMQGQRETKKKQYTSQKEHKVGMNVSEQLLSLSLSLLDPPA